MNSQDENKSFFIEEASKPVKQLKKETKITGALTLACMVIGFGLSVPAFTNVKKQLPLTVFCFKPPVTYTVKNEVVWDKVAKKRFYKKTKMEVAADKKYCQGDKIRVGLADDVQTEREENQQFATKISILKQIPASSAWLPYIGLCGGVLMLTGWIIYSGHTEKLIEHLNMLYHFERLKALMTHTTALADEEVLTTDIGVKVAMTKDTITKNAHSKMNPMSDDDIERARKVQALQDELMYKEFGLNSQLFDEKVAKSEATEQKYKKLRDKYQKSETQISEGKVSSQKEIVSGLKEALNKKENKWIKEVMETVNSVLIYGRAGSGKSFTTASIIYLQSILEDAKLRSIADFDMPDNISPSDIVEPDDKPWDCLKFMNPGLKGGNDNGEEYAEAIQDLMTLCNDGTRSLKSPDKIVYLWDELSRLESLVDKELAVKFIPFLATKCRKKKVKNYVVNHGKTNKQLGGVEGFAETVKNEFLVVRLLSNGKTPMMRGFISNIYNDEGERLDDQPILIPGWLNPSDLMRIKDGDLSPLNKENEDFEDEEDELEFDIDDDLEGDLWAATGNKEKSEEKTKKKKSK